MAEYMVDWAEHTTPALTDMLIGLAGTPLDNVRIQIGNILALLDPQFASIASAIDALEVGGGDAGAAIADLTTRVETLESSMTTVALSLADINSNLDTLDSQVATINAALLALAIYDLGGTWNGTVAANTVVLRHVAGRNLTFADDFAGSVGKSSVAATGSTVFTIKVDEVAVGTMTFAAGATTATFATTGAALNVTIGQVVTVEGPATADATLANLVFTILGKRT